MRRISPNIAKRYKEDKATGNAEIKVKEGKVSIETKRWDSRTGKKTDPSLVPISKEDVEFTIVTLEDELAGAKELLAEIEAAELAEAKAKVEGNGGN